MPVTKQEIVRASSFCHGIQHVEVYTSNIVQAEHFYRNVFGFTPTARTAANLASADSVSVLLQCGEAQLLLTSPVREGRTASRLAAHGEGVRDVALKVKDVRKAFNLACARGATAVQPPTRVEAQSKSAMTAIVGICGSLQHTLVEAEGEMPTPWGLIPERHTLPAPDRGLERIDHIAIGLEPGTLDRFCDLYSDVFELNVTHSEQVITGTSAMNSKVVQNVSGSVTFSMVEPLPAPRRSQVEEFLDYNSGPGAQHIAFLSQDILRTVAAIRSEGIEFLTTPAQYYAGVPKRVGTILEDLNALQEMGVLADRDEYGYLLQIFTKPVQTTPTFFIEIIQRRGAKGFGSGNIRALFEALEREQAARGNL